MEQIRSFIAIELPSEIKAELASLEQRLKTGQHSFVKWVDPEGIHLTLKFLGNIAPATVPQIIESLTGAVQEVSPFRLQLGRLGAFPNLSRPRVVWVGIGGELETLAVLQKAVDSSLCNLGFSPESRVFSPHLTLGRLREKVPPGESQGFGQWASSIEFEPSRLFNIENLSLMRSRLTPGGAIYSQLASLDLKG